MAEGSTTQRPYLIRAMHEWMTDNELTPHLVVDARADGVVAPLAAAEDGRLVLNISMLATRTLDLGNERIEFEARFAGVSQRVLVPIDAVRGIYARETGQGMLFAEEERPGSLPPDTDPDPDEPPPRSHLKIVK